MIVSGSVVLYLLIGVQPSLSLPSNHRKRDRAREEMYRIFNEILQKRRETPSESDEDDMLNTLLQASYK